jgi:hypothetical protein
MSDTDMELLARYTRQQAEDDFAELVRRHRRRWFVGEVERDGTLECN